MPSPIGHGLAGLIVGLFSDRSVRTRTLGEPGAANPWPFFFVCAFLAAAPDLDWIYPPIHRGPTHSVGATVLVILGTAAVTRWSTGVTRWRTAMICGVAYFSHIFMDWLGQDPTPTPGVRALWPLSDRLFMSGVNLFRSTERFEPFTEPQFSHNLLTLAQEVLILAPMLLVLLWRRRQLRR